jgi:hypothetical protein
MAKCSLSFDISQRDPQKILDAAQRSIQGAGGTLTGDTSAGELSVLGVKATYSMGPDKLQVEVIDKPFLISCSRIEGFISSAISDVEVSSTEVAPATTPGVTEDKVGTIKKWSAGIAVASGALAGAGALLYWRSAKKKNGSLGRTAGIVGMSFGTSTLAVSSLVYGASSYVQQKL